METFNNNKTNYRNYLENKNVIIVGPADHVNSGKFIDTFDVVIRLNSGLDLCKKEPRKYGSKTNILYISSHYSYDKLQKDEINKLDFIKFQFPDVKNEQYIHPLHNKVYINNKRIPFSNKILRMDKKYLDFEKEIKTRPNCGITAIWDILRYPIKSLYITGITLSTTKYSQNYINQEILKKNSNSIKMHNLKNMADYCKNNVVNNHKVNYDDSFKKAVYSF